MPKPLPISVDRLQQLVGKYGTPLQLYDETGIRLQAKRLIKAFSSRFPNFKEFYAVKALPNPAILQILLDEGCGLDCSSTSELHIAQELGVPGTDVMFTSNYTSNADLALAAKQGAIINLDDISLVEQLKQATNGKFPETICFRLNPGLGRTDSETKSNVLGGPDAKFGVPTFQIVEGYRRAKAAGAKRFGIHMMTGSCVTKNEYWVEIVQVLVDTMKKISEELDIKFSFMNIGGGLGIPYRENEPVVDVDSVAGILRQKFDELHVERYGVDGKEPNLCVEYGRYMTGPFGFLVSKCQAIKDTYEVYYGLDACMSNLMRPGMYGSYHYISIPTASQRTNETKKANVVGTLCENNDWFAKQRELPVAQLGDLFVIHDTGAHSHSMGFQYNGKLRAPEVLLRHPNGQTESLIRDRETISSLYANTKRLNNVGATNFDLESYNPDESIPPPPPLPNQEEEGCVVQ